MNERQKYIRLFKAIGKIQYLHHEETLAYQLAEMIGDNYAESFTDINEECLDCIEQLIEEITDNG